MKDYFIIIVAIFVLICSCILCYRAGYEAGCQHTITGGVEEGA